MRQSKDPKELWEPRRGLEDPVLRYVLSFLVKSDCPPLQGDQGDRILDQCKALNIQPIVYESLKEDSDKDLNDSTWFQTLRVESLKIAGACSYRQQTIHRIVKALHRAGTKPILLKGPALAHTVYPHAHWRTSFDIDLLINASEWGTANEVMLELGYQSSTCLNWGFLSFEKSYAPSETYPEAPLVELHLRLNNRPALCVFSYQELLVNATLMDLLGEHVLIPNKIEHFIYLCVHRIGHFPEDRRFAWLMDLYFLSRTFSDQEWEQLVELADVKKVVNILRVCLEDLNHVLQLEIPGSVRSTLDKRSADEGEESSRYLYQRYSKAHDLVNRWLEIPSTKTKLAYLWRWIFPPKSYMNASFKSKHGLLQHMERILKGIRKYF